MRFLFVIEIVRFVCLCSVRFRLFKSVFLFVSIILWLMIFVVRFGGVVLSVVIIVL